MLPSKVAPHTGNGSAYRLAPATHAQIKTRTVAGVNCHLALDDEPEAIVKEKSGVVSPGGTATYSLTLAPLGNFDQAVSLTCLGAPSEASCSVNPVIVTPNGTSASTVTVTVSTTAPSDVRPVGLINWPRATGCSWTMVFEWLMLSVLLCLGAGRFGQPRFARPFCPATRLRRLAPAVLLVASLLTACGGGSKSNNLGTPASTYKLTLTGTSGSLSHSITLTLTVN